MKKITKVLVSVSITLVLVYFLLTQLDYKDIIKIFTELNFSYILLAFFSYLIANFFKSLRFYFLLDKKIRLFDLFNIASIHNMFTGLLPFRSGELSFIYLTSKQGIKKTKSLFSIITARFFDLIIIFLIFFFTGILAGLSPKLKIAVYLVPLILIFGAGISIAIANHIDKLKQHKLLKIKILNYIYTKISETISNLKKLNLKKAIIVFFITFFIWTFSYLCGYLIVIDMGLAMQPLNIVHVFTLTTILSILPISGLVGFGTTEAIWTIAFMLYGINKEIAISTGFSYHIINIIFFTILGLIGFTNKTLFSKKK